jgi:hypothetical protein
VGPPSLAQVLELALFLRVLAALAVEWHVQRGGSGRIDLFPDTEYYWLLAGTILRGLPYEVVEWGDIPRFAVRTPGYPLFLALCRTLLGDRPLGTRLLQAGLGVLTVYLVFRLTSAARDASGSASEPEMDERRWNAPLLAALLTAIHPYLVMMSVILLSEALFAPLMIATLWGLSVLWNGAGDRQISGSSRAFLIAMGAGACAGVAILVRPSWALFLPPPLLVFVASRLRSEKARGWGRPVGQVAVFAMGFCLVMAPWWVRNARVFGAFVPTAVWMGASLYDGLHPGATGASDMSFMESPEFWPLDEIDQDRELTRRALDWARSHPQRVASLAAVKLGRFWSPWPNAGGMRSAWLAAACTLAILPFYAVTALGLWTRRQDVRAWVLLAGPLLYFCSLHLVFTSSMRYRIPAELPAMGLSATGVLAAAGRFEGPGKEAG